MPFSSVDDPSLPSDVLGAPAEQRRRFVSAFNSAIREDPDEGRAFRIARAAMKARADGSRFVEQTFVFDSALPPLVDHQIDNALARLRSVVQSAGRLFERLDARWVVGVDRDLPVVEGTWDEGEARAALGRWAEGVDGEIDPRKFAWAFLVHDADAQELRTSYRLPVATIRSGRLVAVSNALRAALSAIPKTKGLPTSVRDRARAAARSMLERFNERKA